MGSLFTIAVTFITCLCLYGNDILGFQIDLNPYLPYRGVHTGASPRLVGFHAWNCNNYTKTKVVTLNEVTMTPDPLHFGGIITLSAVFTVSKDIGVHGDELSVDMVLGMKMGTKYKDMCPLFGPIYCHATRLCEKMKKGATNKCPKIVTDQGNNCTCPIRKKVYEVKGLKFILPPFPVKLTGSFDFLLSLKNQKTDMELGCFEFQFCIEKCN